MNARDRFEEIVRNDLEVRAGDGAYERMHRLVLAAHGSTEKTRTSTFAGRIIMKSSVVKLGIAAAIIAVLGVGIREFIGAGSRSGVVWADVARRVDNCRGVIYRMQETGSDGPKEADHAIAYSAPTRERADYYRGDQIVRSIYADYASKTVVYVLHEQKRCVRDTHSLGEFNAQEHESWVNPRGLVQKFLSCKHSKLEPRVIEGMRCDGLATTDPAFFGSGFPVTVHSVNMQLWVSTETGYPVLFQGEVLCGQDGKRRIEGTADQFQWDVDIDPDKLEPQIPVGYTSEEWPS